LFSVIGEHCAENVPGEFKEEDLIQILSLFLIFLLGIAVRVFLKKTKWSVPYTVVLMVLGLFVGQLARNVCPYLHPYTAIARTKPEIILMTFLPILIFESAFSISVHTFKRSSVQVWIAFTLILKNFGNYEGNLDVFRYSFLPYLECLSPLS